jgi:hypothetical protein
LKQAVARRHVPQRSHRIQPGICCDCWNSKLIEGDGYGVVEGRDVRFMLKLWDRRAQFWHRERKQENRHPRSDNEHNQRQYGDGDCYPDRPSG